MKKSPFIIGLSLAAILALTGCGNNTSNDAAVIDKLSGQLDRVVNTVSAITTLNEGDVSLSNMSNKITNKTSLSKLSGAYQSAKNLSTNIENNKQSVLKKVKMIKRDIAGDVKLGNENARAISELTSAMQRYTTSLNKTKSDYRNTVRSMSKLSNFEGSEIDAKITRLSCCMEARDCYMNNILCTLDNIQSILDGLEDEDSKTDEKLEEPAPNEAQKEAQPPIEQKPMDENKDYLDNHDDGNYLDRHDNNTSNMNAEIPQPAIQPGYNMNGTNGWGAYPNNGWGYNGYNNGGYGNGMFNPNRNTDTYGPGITNIDTYRNFGNGMYGNGMYGYGNGRHFGGSNGVNNVAEPEIANETPVIEEPAEFTTANVEEPEEIKEEAVKEEMSSNGEQKEILNAKAFDVKKPIKQNRSSPNNQKAPIPSKALDRAIAPEKKDDAEEENSLKVKSVQADTEVTGEEKVKGHTQTVSSLADVNETIEKLIKE